MSEMFDRINRKIEYLRISITDRCNLRCVYCMPEDGIQPLSHEEILSYEEIIRIVKVAAELGISKVRVTGGEPLIRKNVSRLIGEIGRIQGINDISLTTNGVLLAKLAAELKGAGLKRLNISLDSLDPERFEQITRGSNLPAVLDGLARAEELGFDPIKINSVSIRGFNDSEAVDFARLTIEKPLHVRFIEFMPIGARDMWDESRVVTAEELRGRISAEFGPLEKLESKGADGPASMYRISGAKGLIGFISPLSHHFCGECNRLRLTAEGKLRPCLFSESEIDLKTPMRTGCEDEEIARLIGVALSVKPEGHQMAEGIKNKYQRTMSRIGG